MLLYSSTATEVPNFRGRYSSVSMHCELDVAVCVYDQLLYGREICYSVGKVDKEGYKIGWGDVSRNGNFTGVYPSVSLIKVRNEFYAIESHAGGVFNNTCYYCVGKVDEKQMSIDWGDSHPICLGGKPRVCANDDGTVIIAHEESHYVLSSRSIQCDVFDINTAERSLVRRHECEEVCLRGVEPSITMSRDTVVLANRLGSNLQTLVGTINGSGRICWNPDSCMICPPPEKTPVTGREPTISINSSHHVVESHMSTTLSKVDYNCGYIHEKNIVWKSSDQLNTSGEHPSISLADDGHFVEMHKTNSYYWKATLFIQHGHISLVE